jgi:hypothetical protein
MDGMGRRTVVRKSDCSISEIEANRSICCEGILIGADIGAEIECCIMPEVSIELFRKTVN